MKEYLPIMQDCPLFDGVSREDISGMMGCLGARLANADRGEFIFREGDSTTFVGIVLMGSVDLIREDFYGNRSIVASVGRQQLFGESYAFADAGELPVSVVAKERSVLLLLDSRRITTCCSSACAFHSRVIFNLLRLVATKNLLLHQKIDVTSKRSTREKLMTYLLIQAKQQGSDIITIPYDRQALADYLDVDRSGLSAEISRLRREGILESNKNRFHLLRQHAQK